MFQDTVADFLQKLTWTYEGQNVHFSFPGRYGGFCCATPMNINNADYWSSRRWRLILSRHSPSHRVIFRDCTPTSYGAWAPFSLQILDTKDSYSVFIAFKVTDHRCDGPLCLQNVWAVGTIGLLTEYLLHYTHALWDHLPNILKKELLESVLHTHAKVISIDTVILLCIYHTYTWKSLSLFATFLINNLHYPS